MKSLLAFLLVLIAQQAIPCSTFFINHNGQMVFGRNYDWVSGAGMVHTNQRGLLKTSYKVADGSTISWTSRYGSLTFNQYGKEFPTGGMNEKGLVVELMWLDETVYPKQDARAAIGVLQWIQYQLDNCATIEEVIATDKQLRITSTGSPLHYLVADAQGKAAAIEFLDGKMVVHKGDQLSFAVLTNSLYAQSAQEAKQSLAGNDIPGNNSSIGRFTRACSMINRYEAGSKTSLTDHAFNILSSVKQGDHTKWSIVYDITNRKVFFKTLDAPKVKTVSFSAFNFSCQQQAFAFDMNQPGKDNVSSFFKPFNHEMNQKAIGEAARQSNGEVTISATTQQAMAAYPSLISCK
ncbi:MAG: linear amide C-N hydrolase [Chitinophagaceae bacterium]